MKYQESELIKQRIVSSNKVLVNCHQNPDADSVGSAVAMARVLKNLGKDVRIISPTEVSKNLRFLLNKEQVEVVDFKDFDFWGSDLFVALDSASWSRVTGSQTKRPEIPIINIDHHVSNQKYGEINLVIANAAANCEVLYFLFTDWGVDMSLVAEPLLAGIIGDTGAFRFPEAGESTFRAALELMKFSDKNKIIFNLYQSFEESHVSVWREIMNNLKIDREHKFVYSFVERKVLEKNGKPWNAKSELADMIFQSIDGTDFGLVGAEDEGYISVSFRSRSGVDVSNLARSLGGGGHAWAAAARITYNNDTTYEKAVEIVLKKAREWARGNRRP